MVRSVDELKKIGGESRCLVQGRRNTCMLLLMRAGVDAGEEAFFSCMLVRYVSRYQKHAPCEVVASSIQPSWQFQTN
jgi:hypothetical protein